MAANFNKVYLMGNLTADPELRYTPKGTAVADLRLAINRYIGNSGEGGGERQEETTFVDVTTWGKTAEIAKQYLAKGRPVFIEGRLQLDTWEDKATGQKRSRLRVVCENLQMLGNMTNREPGSNQNRPGNYSQGNNYGQNNYQPPQASNSNYQPMAEPDDNDIPF